MGQKVVSAPEALHDDDITPYTAPIMPREHLDVDKEVRYFMYVNKLVILKADIFSDSRICWECRSFY
jgi:hypothetical protein